MDAPKKPTNTRFPTAKIGAIARFKSLTGTITSRRQSNSQVFPPPSWEIDNLIIDSNHGWDQTKSEPPFKTPSGEEAVARLSETVTSTEVPVDFEPEEVPGRLTLAQRIRDLIESLPLPGALTPSKQPAVDDMPESQVLSAGAGSASPAVPPGVDQELVFMLSSEEVMNGEEGDGRMEESERQSVWSILSNMKWKGKGKEIDADTDADPGLSPSSNQTQHGLMMYAPLEPANDSQVELAEVYSTSDASLPPGSPVQGQPPDGVKWVPSTTQISVYATWWGYRLYLPPPAMTTLDSMSLKATAQAAMVTGALKWLLNKIPDILVPAQFRPALVLIRRLSPVVGYIGVFVAWSWGRIKKHDKGNGVVLTATWLLPVALVPMAWDAGDIFGPLLLPKPEDRVVPPSQDNDKEQSKEKKRRFWHL